LHCFGDEERKSLCTQYEKVRDKGFL